VYETYRPSFEPEPEPDPYLPMPQVARTPFFTYALLVINIVVFGLATLAGGTEDPQVLLDFGAMFGPLISDGEYWRLFTAMFLHSGVMHLGFNGFALFIFGQMVEKSYGHSRFLLIYVLAGLMGSVTSYLFNSISIGAGASGAIFGVIGALAAYFLVQRQTFGKQAQNSLIGVAVIVAIQLFLGLSSSGIDNWAHIGGLVSGFILGLTLSPHYRRSRSVFGYSMIVNTTGSLILKWWVVPVTFMILFVGIVLADGKLPDNSFTHFFRAERHYQLGEYDEALDELESALDFERPTAEAHLLRAKIYAEAGDTDLAMQELGLAIRFGNRNIRAEALRVRSTLPRR
jgi:rhomboid protease GluP